MEAKGMLVCRADMVGEDFLELKWEPADLFVVGWEHTPSPHTLTTCPHHTPSPHTLTTHSPHTLTTHSHHTPSPHTTHPHHTLTTHPHHTPSPHTLTTHHTSSPHTHHGNCIHSSCYLSYIGGSWTYRRPWATSKCCVRPRFNFASRFYQVLNPPSFPPLHLPHKRALLVSKE